MKNFKHLYIFILILSFLGCKNKEIEKESEHEELPPNIIEFSIDQFNNSGIVLDTLNKKIIDKKITLSGNISVPPQSFATVCAPFGGYVKSSNLMQGSYVSKGQILAIIENSEFVDLQQNYIETKSKLNFAEIEYNRQKDLNNSNVNSTKTFQQAELDYNVLEAQFNGIIQKLLILGIDYKNLTVENIKSSIPLVSPISGYIKNANINIGKNVSSDDILFEIVNTDKLNLELNVFEKDLLFIQKGQTVEFSNPNDPQKIYNATITQVGNVLDDDKTSKVFAEINSKNQNMIAGMFVNAEITIKSKESICLPSEAVVQFDEKFYVFALKEIGTENGKQIYLFEAIEIEKGTENDGYTEIIFNNDYSKYKFVVKGAYYVLSKFKNSGEMSC